MKRVFSFLSIALLILSAAAFIILYARGYRVNINDKKLSGTGILSASSYPDKASILINSKLMSATSASLSLDPGWYEVKIAKEGYVSWEKKIRVQKEIVSQIDALLIPQNPSLRAITVSGISNPVLSPGGSKIAFMIPPDSSATGNLKPKSGIFIIDLKNNFFSGKSDAKQVYEPAGAFDWNNTVLSWSPDEKQLMAKTFTKDAKGKATMSRALLLNTDNGNTLPTEVSSTFALQTEEWMLLASENERMKQSILPDKIRKFLPEFSGTLQFSPDETKVLYMATSSAEIAPVIDPPMIGANSTEENRKLSKGKYYVYDIKEDKNYLVASPKDAKNPGRISWYSDSKHLITVEKNVIYITDFDGSNKRQVYSGPFMEDYVYAFPSGNRLAIVTNFQNSGLPNLYELDLR